MKAIDKASAQTWCASHGIAIGDDGLPAVRVASDLQEFAIPQDAGARVALVRGHMRSLQEEDEVCVWLDDWDVWQSGQRWHILDRFRLSYGVTETIAKNPCHLVRKEDFETTVSLVVFSVLMLADCHVLGSSGRSYAFYSHDEFGKKTA